MDIQKDVVSWRLGEEDSTSEASDQDSAVEICVAFKEDEVDKDDTTAEQHLLEGKDIQGIPWQRLQFTRQHYRETRLSQYHNYLNLEDIYDAHRETLQAECLHTVPNGRFYDFHRNHRSVRSTIVHFQLRNLVWATSKHDVYTMHDNCVKHWSGITRQQTEVLNLSGRALEGQPRSSLGHVQVSTICVGGSLVAAGGFQGELVVRNYRQEALAFSSRITLDENGITNAIEISQQGADTPRLITSNNDKLVRVFDSQSFQITSKYCMDWAVNFATQRPGGSGLLAVVGDDPATLLLDAKTGNRVHTLEGHLDYSFAAAWHPSGILLATGNQDTTTRVWDLRRLDKSLAALQGTMGAIRSLRFSPDGSTLAVAEPADFVHLHDVQSDFVRRQDIDLFGEISGTSFSPDAEELFLSVADMTYSSLLQFHQHKTSDIGVFDS